MPDSFPPRPTRARRERIAGRLLAWYRANARDLPWRRTRDAYAIWVSEAMLQQTRVETVLAYWPRFLERFPSARHLAEAPEEAVLAAWSGLGYYRRARALRAAAQVVVAEHDGHFPAEREAALALPGVGAYTAGAVLSIAYDQGQALVDGNVERVFARLFALDAPAGAAALAKECWALAEAFVPQDGGAGEWNQALMELGATVCTPRAPRCDGCPLARDCRGRRAGRAEALPGPKAKPAPIDVTLELALAERGDELLLEQRGDEGRMAGLWQLPTVERPAAAGRTAGLFPAEWRAALELGEELLALRHGITRHRIRARLRRARLCARRLPPGWRWVPRGAAGELALTGMAKKALRALQHRAPLAEGPS